MSLASKISLGFSRVSTECKNLWTALRQVAPTQSSRDFVSGTLIKTNIDYSQTAGEPWLLEIEGNSYGNGIPFLIRVQGYIYADSIINYGGISLGTALSSLYALNFEGYLCFWFPRQNYWHGYTVFVNDSYDGKKENRLVSITDQAKPAGTKEVNLTSTISIGWHSGNFNPAGKVDTTDARLSDARTPADLSVTYGKVSNNLKSKASVTNTIDLSANGIGAITLTGNTAFSFSGFELNKTYTLIITANGFTPSWADGTKHVPVTGNEAFSTSGVFYVSLTCIDATAGSEKLLTTIMKGA